MSEKPEFDPSQRLTIKRERFLFEYLKDGNATRSYRVAYDCDKASDKTIWNDAYKLLNKPEVAARLERLREQRAEVAALDKNTVLGVACWKLRSWPPNASKQVRWLAVGN
jgi:phage terminase small subunit